MCEGDALIDALHRCTESCDQSIAGADYGLVFRPSFRTNEDKAVSCGSRASNDGSSVNLLCEIHHVTCLDGGLLALSGHLLDNDHLVNGEIRRTEGCNLAHRTRS